MVALRTRKPTALARSVAEVALGDIRPAAVNDQIYKPVRTDDPAIEELAASIRERGVTDPIQITRDGVIVSGHRRYAAARLAGLTTVPVIRRDDLHSTDDEFVREVVEANRSREKTAAEQIREQIAATDPAQALESLRRRRDKDREAGAGHAEAAGLVAVHAGAAARRDGISDAKRPMLDAAKKIIEDNRVFWPLTVRQVHYRMLNVGVLRHTGRKGSTYVNDLACYKDLSNLMTRARLTGEVSWLAITDPTRPARPPAVHRSPAAFIRQELDWFLNGYYRDLLQSQDFYLEVVAEKLTVETPVKRAAKEFTATYSIGRGYGSIDFKHEVAKRFRQSGKPFMKLLMLGDFDPEGEDIVRNMASSLRDEFDVDVDGYKVALTPDQVRAFGLPPNLLAKKTSSRAKGFTARHGKHAYELEALEPAALQTLVRDAITAAIDMDRFRADEETEAGDAATIAAFRATAQKLLAGAIPD
jgi:ParB-like chromosome segregation protein Spo0J